MAIAPGNRIGTYEVAALIGAGGRGGIYLATDKPIAKGKRVRMLLDVQAYTIPLVGTVAWVRLKEEPGKPKGMGVQLQQPPALFQRYVEEVQEKMEQLESDQTETVGKA